MKKWLVVFLSLSVIATNAFAWISTDPENLKPIKGTSWQISNSEGSWQFDFDPRIYYSDAGYPYIYSFDDAGGFYQTCYGENPFDTRVGFLTIPVVPDDLGQWILYFNINGSSLSGTSYFSISDFYFSETQETGTYIGVYKVPWCPAKTALGDDSEKLQVLYNLRDNVLSKSFIGRSIINLYYKTGPAICQAIKASPKFKQLYKSTLGWFIASMPTTLLQ